MNTFSTRDTALATVISDDFAPAFILLVATTLRHNPWLECPWIVLSPPGSLSVASRRDIAQVYPGIVFADDTSFGVSSLQREGKRELDTPERLMAAFLILEVFRFDQYERIVCLDADMLCFGDISHLFEVDADFAAVRALAPTTEEPLPFFNSGVFVVGQRYLGGPTYSDVVKRTRLADVDPRTGKADQAVLNRFFSPHRVSWLSRRYNSTKRLFGDGVLSVEAEIQRRDVRLLHYVGAKPWTRAMNERDKGFESVNALWRAEARRMLTPSSFSALLDSRRNQAVSFITVQSGGE